MQIQLTDLATRINHEHKQCEAQFNRALHHALTCGELLTQAKAQVQHGEWGEWLKANTAIPHRTVSMYMRLAKNRHIIESKMATVAILGVRDAIALLTESKPQDEVNALLNNPNDFLLWLSDHDPNQIVGNPRSTWNCAEAKWIFDRTGKRRDIDPTVDSPSWLIAFIREAIEHERFTAATAIACLMRAKRCTDRESSEQWVKGQEIGCLMLMRDRVKGTSLEEVVDCRIKSVVGTS